MTEKSRKMTTRFHPNHGENIALYDDNTMARREQSFANALAFSEKPLEPGEIFLLQIERNERGWSGHMRFGLTMIDPSLVGKKELPEFALPNLAKLGNTWIVSIPKSRSIWDNYEVISDMEGTKVLQREKKLITDGVNVQTSRGIIPFNVLKPNTIGSSCNILPTDTGSRIGVMYIPQSGTDKAEMHFIINGEDQGVCAKDIPYTAGPLRAVIDIYGNTKQVRVVQLYGVSTLQSACRDTILQYTKRDAIKSLPLPRMLKDYLLYQSQ